MHKLKKDKGPHCDVLLSAFKLTNFLIKTLTNVQST